MTVKFDNEGDLIFTPDTIAEMLALEYFLTREDVRAGMVIDGEKLEA
jgi:hypothetical protein